MAAEIIVKYVHFISIFGIIGSLVGEHLLLKPTMTRGEIKRISRLDSIYGLCAITLLAAGMTLWFGVGKPADYYSHNWIFHLKIGLFVIVGILSIIPTMYYIRNRKGDAEESVQVPGRIVMLVRIQLLIMFLIPALATLMAKGYGSF